MGKISGLLGGKCLGYSSFTKRMMTPVFPIQLISAASILGLKPSGVELLPQALLDAGLDQLPVQRPLVRVPDLNAGYSTQRDPLTQCLNPGSLRDFSLGLFNVMNDVLNRQQFPVVLGGDCSILIGIMAALKSRGRYGLVFADAHADFYQPFESPTGEVADMELGIVAGRGPAILSDINGLSPYVLPEHIVQVGQRDGDEVRQYGGADLQSAGITVFDLDGLRSQGFEASLKSIVACAGHLDVAGRWIHFDTDVLDDEINPAVDYRLPGGLAFEEMTLLIRTLISETRITGLSVSIFNPSLDKSGIIATGISRCLVNALSD